ncbi:MAG: citrate/2-methylcitrate synthase [Acidimicrobiales bacterium]
MPETVTITDNRTGQSVEIPIVDGGIDAKEFAKLMPGTWFYDPSFSATASTSSAITDLDGVNGILRYRGYPIEQLAEQSTFLEVCYLLLNGELPNAEQMDTWVHDVTYHTFIHENMRKRFMEGFHHDAQPDGHVGVGHRSAVHLLPRSEGHRRSCQPLPADQPIDLEGPHPGGHGLPGQHRHAVRLPDNNLSYAENFLSMMWRVAEPN